MLERDGAVERIDLEAYEPRWVEPVESSYLGNRVLTRGGLSNLVFTLDALPSLQDVSPAERALILASVLIAPPYTGHGEPIGDTTNLVAVDPDGNACVVTTSLGLGSGDFLPGLDIHLNSMLGEVDLHVQPLVPGTRMESMMSPTVVVDDGGLTIAAGAAGGTRLRPALVQVLSGILDEGFEPQAAVDRPRLHSAGEIVRVEPGFEDEVYTALDDAGYDVRRFDAIHHYFGGVSLLARSGGAADPRRSGAALTLP
jgi:gamma-glutamyltranspeptidase/glutathione hydrolase